MKGDAAGELDTGDGTWTEELRERYADRVQARLARHIPDLESAVLARDDPLPRRPAGGEPEPRPRRPVRGLARARPELRLAAVPGQPGPPHAGRPALAHRREHLAGPGARRGLRDARRPGAAAAAGATRAAPAAAPLRRPEPACPQPERCGKIARRSAGWRSESAGVDSPKEVCIAVVRRAPRFSISQISTFAGELRRTTSTPTPPPGSTGSASGSSSCPRTATTPRRSRPSSESGLESRVGGAARAVDPAAAAARRADRPGRAHRRALRVDPPARPFRPGGIVCLTGSGLGLDPDDARAIVADGLRTLAAEAELAGVRDRARAVPARRRRGVDDRDHDPRGGRADRGGGDHPSLGLQFDVWHLWNTPTLLDDIRREAGRFAGVHVSDVRSPTRSWADRVLPGDGVADVPAVLARARRGRLAGPVRPGDLLRQRHVRQRTRSSLWDVPAGELARRGRAAMVAAWESSVRELAASRHRLNDNRRKDEIREDRRGRARGRSAVALGSRGTRRGAKPPSRPARRS